MDLSEYPHPPEDTGLGIHWSAGPAGAVTMQELRRRWLPELRAMHIKWVKTLHDGAEGLVQELLANDIMPIVRLYRHQPNPGRLDRELKNRVTRFVDLGVRYFEVNNEPNLMEEWQPGEWEKAGSRLPAVVVDHWITDAEYVLEQGGLPAFPAPTPGGHWDDVDFLRKALDEVQKRGREDLFRAGAWLAIHNYFLNHPPDYPYDDVNQFGTPISSESTNAHRFRDPIPEVNRQRRQNAVPGRTLHEDSNCFLKYRLYRGLFVERFDFEVPLLTTEGGAVLNRAQDPRYPIVDPELHKAYNLFAFTHMVDAPAYYFCNCPWLIANAEMNHNDPHWEDNAWYSTRWQGGQLPIVEAVKARTPWPVRETERRTGTLDVTVDDGADQVAIVRRSSDNTFVADARIDRQNRVQIDNLRPGTYRVGVAGTNAGSDPVELTEDGRASLSMQVPPRTSAIVGQIANAPADARVQLFALDDAGTARVRREVAVTNARFRFDGLPAGRYRIGLAGRPEVTRGPIELDGRDTAHVTLSVPRTEWRYMVQENTSGGQATNDRRSVVQLIAPALRGRSIQLHAPWAVISERIGNKPEINPDAAVIDSLPAGTYRITVPSIPGDVSVTLDGRGTATIRLRQEEVPVEADASRIVGRLTNVPSSATLPTDVRLLRDDREVAQTRTDAEGIFVFEDLPAGSYVVRVPAFSLESTPFELDGQNEFSFRLRVPPGEPPAQSRIRAAVTNASTLPVDVFLMRDGNQVAQTATDAEGIFVFEGLPAGKYVVRVPAYDLVSTPITLDGENERTFQLRVPDPTPPVEEPMPDERPPEEPPSAAASTIEGRIVGAPTLPAEVELVSGGTLITAKPTSASGSFTFRTLPAGTYTIRVPAYDLTSESFELDGTNNRTIQLRVSTTPGDEPAREPAIQTYLWLVPGPLEPEALYLLALPLVRKTGWTVGTNVDAARNAEAVVIIGGTKPEDSADLPIRATIVNADPLALAAELASFEVTI